MTNTITLPQLAWFGVKELKLAFPDSWDVEVCNMAGYDRPRMKPDEIKAAIGSPIGMAPLREYARGKKEVVILFDDMARVTRAAEIVPHVLEELAAAGIEDRQIRFIGACGCHGTMNRSDFVKKLGEDVLRRFPVYNHAPWENCEYVGTTTRGTKLSFNTEVMKCDLKIGIGSVVPHIMAGFGGGGKIMLPGVASYETIIGLHTPQVSSEKTGLRDTVTGMGIVEDNPRRRDINEAVEIAGLDMKIDTLVNFWGETVALFAGVPMPTYTAALVDARTHYLTPAAKDKDIVIANSYAKVNEAISGLMVAFPSIKQQGGDAVLIANSPNGQVTHYLMGPFGNEIGGRLRLQMKPPQNINRLIIYSEYPELAGKNYLQNTGKLTMMDNLDEIMALLQESYGDNARVAVYPNADIQYCQL